MKIRLHQMAFGLRRGVLGASSNRMAIWTQGCSLNKCKGCMSSHTWTSKEGFIISVEKIINLALNQRNHPNGLTISGGEPSDQAKAVVNLINEFRAFFKEKEVILYSGLRWSQLFTKFPKLACLPDVVIAGPYLNYRPTTSLAGSNNQEVKILTPLGKKLYRNWQSWPLHSIQIRKIDNQHLVAVGIANPHQIKMVENQINWNTFPKTINKS